jgi:SAM-dependent methyltransferase
MVEYAQISAHVQRLDDMASFRVMDIRQPLAFPDHHFDLVNARFLAGVLDPASWASLVAECVRITVPGGRIRLTEVECWSSTSGPLQRLFALLARALHDTGRSCSPDGRTFGIAPLLPGIMRAAGVQDISLYPFVLDGSAQAPRHVSWCENLHSAFSLLKPFLVETAHLIAAAEYDCLLDEAELAMYGSDFCALAFGLTVWGVTLMPPPLPLRSLIP